MNVPFATFALRCCVVLLGAYPTIAQTTKLLGTAHSVHIVSDVVYNKNRRYDSQPIPTASLYRTGLFKLFREVESDPDIIIKFHKDVFGIDTQTVSITVFNADDNSVIYSEERKLVDEQNDVDRLVSHFLATFRRKMADFDQANRPPEINFSCLRGRFLPALTFVLRGGRSAMLCSRGETAADLNDVVRDDSKTDPSLHPFETSITTTTQSMASL